jgi:beta-hydroxyacyl-ACP dehydratase FabZ
VLDINEVMRILPHRYPFLLVDRIVGFEGENKCTGVKNVTINEPFFQGHFPGHPIMPGVLQLEAMAQVASIVLLRMPGNQGKIGYFMSANNVKWRKPVLPGDTLIIETEMLKVKRSIAQAVPAAASSTARSFPRPTSCSASSTADVHAYPPVNSIHPTAIIDPSARLGAGVTVGPYCIIGRRVELGDGCHLQHHVTIMGPSRIGRDNQFYAYGSIGQQTQDLKYRVSPPGWKWAMATPSASSAPSSRHQPGRQDDHRQPQPLPLLRPHRPRLHRRQSRHLLQQRHPRRPRDRGGPRHPRRPQRRASVLPHRHARHHRWLLEDRPGRAALLHRRRQSGTRPRPQHRRPAARRLQPRANPRPAPGLPQSLSQRL